MSTAALFDNDTHTVSFELYPPRDVNPHSSVWIGVSRLVDAHPDFISITYGAAGARADSRDRSVKLLLEVLRTYPNLPAVAHLTCLGSTRGELQMIVRLLLHAGVRDFLALRGDMPPGGIAHIPPAYRLNRAVELVALIRDIADEVCPDDKVSIAVAAYPASRGKARLNDLAALQEKWQAGADYAITQVFYDPEDYISMVRELKMSGCRMPVVPGILPLTDIKRLRALETLAGVKIPPGLKEIHDCPDARERIERSLAATMNLISRVLDAGAPGIHIYSFNRPRPTLDVVEHLRGAGYLTGTGGRVKTGPIDTELVGLALQRLTPA